MKLLKDSNSEVQGMALKCLSPLTVFVEVVHAGYIVDKLLDHVLESDASKARVGGPDNVSVKALRDVSSLGLQSIFSEVEPGSVKAGVITKEATPRLVGAVRTTKAAGDSTDIVIETLELLHVLLGRMGSFLLESHENISAAVFHQLPSRSAMISKRAISCLGSLAATCDNDLFASIVERAKDFLQSQDSQSAIRTGVQIIWSLSKTAGHRLDAHVPVLAPILFDYSSSDKYEDDDDLREHCIQALGSFCLRCKREMVAFSEVLVENVITLAKYDPNYVGDDGEDEDNVDGMGEDGMDEDFGDDEDYSDDDDMSWKVRRASIRCLRSAISVELIPRSELFAKFGPFLVTRFKEREESVKLDVFAAFSELLRLCSHESRSSIYSSSPGAPEMHAGDAMAVDASDSRPEMAPLLSIAPQIMHNVKKELNSRSLKTRIKAMSLLRDVVSTMPSVVASLVTKVIPEVERCLGEGATAMKTESLLLLRGVVSAGGSGALKEHIRILIPRVLATTDDRYYKVTAECLRFCGEAVIAFGACPASCAAMISPHVASVHDAALRRATAQDQDSEVKEAALHCLGGTVSFFKKELGDQRLRDIGVVFCDRLGNEVTRLAAVRALHCIALSESADVLVPVMNEIAALVGGFLRKNNPTLKLAAVDMLSVAPSLPPVCDEVLVANISELITDSDLRLTCMALQLAARIVRMRGGPIVTEVAKNNSVYQRAMILTRSPLLQGRAVTALIGLYRTLAEANTLPLTVEGMLKDLMGSAGSITCHIMVSSARSSPLHCIAKCIVAVCDAAKSSLRSKISEQIICDVDAEVVSRRIFSLVCLGEFGRSSTVVRSDAEVQRVRETVLAALEAPQDDVRTAAALALGGITSAQGARGVPALIYLMKQRPDLRYLLLISLKDAISSSNSTDLGPVVPMLLPILLSRTIPVVCKQQTNLSDGNNRNKNLSEEESVRTATAECLGLLACFTPEPVLKSLTEGASSVHSDIRASVAAAVKFAVSASPVTGQSLAPSLRCSMGSFIDLIGDSDVLVSKNALQAMNAVAKSRPSLLVADLPKALQFTFSRLKKDKNLVRVVDLGPFKHEEDFGLDMRKSAFDCMRTFISGPLRANMQLAVAVEHVLIGLADHSDVRAIAQLILATAAATPSAAQLVTIVDDIVKALEATFNEKVKQNAVRQETERHNDSIRGALRAVRMLETVPEVADSRCFQTFMASVVRTSKYLDKYDAIGQSDVELMTFGNMANAENGLVGDRNDVVMSDR